MPPRSHCEYTRAREVVTDLYRYINFQTNEREYDVRDDKRCANIVTIRNAMIIINYYRVVYAVEMHVICCVVNTINIYVITRNGGAGQRLGGRVGGTNQLSEDLLVDARER